MPALMIINYNSSDPEALGAYRDAAIPILIGPELGSLKAVTDETVDLGEGGEVGSTTVILEFESVEAARRIYDSPEYQAILGDRLAATEPVHAMIVPTPDA